MDVCCGMLAGLPPGKDFGFIKPSSALPGEYVETKDVYFHFTSLMSKTREVELTRGIELKFYVDTKSTVEKPRASQVWFTDEVTPPRSEPKRHPRSRSEEPGAFTPRSRSQSKGPGSSASRLAVVVKDIELDEETADGGQSNLLRPTFQPPPAGKQSSSAHLHRSIGMMDKLTGVVVKLDRQKGFGFIQADTLPEDYIPSGSQNLRSL